VNQNPGPQDQENSPKRFLIFCEIVLGLLLGLGKAGCLAKGHHVAIKWGLQGTIPSSHGTGVCVIWPEQAQKAQEIT
jgi:hypothetical protein